MNAAPLEVLGKQMKIAFITLVALIVGGMFLINNKFDKIDEKFAKIDEKFAKIDGKFDKIDEKFDKIDERFIYIENTLQYIKARVDEHTIYDSSRISVLQSVTSHYKICDSVSVVHFVQFQQGNQVLSGGITVAHSFCASGVPDKLVFDCESLDIAIVPECPQKGR
jgi:hypothetical protein